MQHRRRLARCLKDGTNVGDDVGLKVVLVRYERAKPLPCVFPSVLKSTCASTISRAVASAHEWGEPSDQHSVARGCDWVRGDCAPGEAAEKWRGSREPVVNVDGVPLRFGVETGDIDDDHRSVCWLHSTRHVSILRMAATSMPPQRCRAWMSHEQRRLSSYLPMSMLPDMPLSIVCGSHANRAAACHAIASRPTDRSLAPARLLPWRGAISSTFSRLSSLVAVPESTDQYEPRDG